MRDQTVQVDDLSLVALPTAVTCVDLFVRFTLTEWRVESLIPQVRDIARALITAVVGSVEARSKATPTMLLFRLRLSGTSLAIEIEDDRRTPTLTVPTSLSDGDAGVNLLSTGKQLIWAQVPLPGGMDAASVALPRRGTTRAVASPAPPSVETEATDGLEPEMIERILESLRRDRGADTGSSS